MTGDTETPGHAETTGCDFDLHGVVGVRLVDALPSDVETVRRQLGPLQTTLDREPDITIRFVDRVTTRPLTYVGLGDTGFNDDGFFVLRGKGGISAKALLPFADIGRRPTVICERAMPAVPHLLTMINLVALSKGVLPLHASAFNAGGLGVLVTGWAKGGKTESLLACARGGAHYVGDEWVYLTPDGEMMGLPEPIRLWAWQLRQLRQLARSRPAGQRIRLASWRAVGAMTRASSTHLPGAGLTRKALPVIERQAYLQIPPADLFGADHLDLRGHLDAAVLVVSHTSPDITVSRATPTEIAARMQASLADERAMFSAHHRQFRFAFPEQHDDTLDAVAETETRLLRALFDGRPAAKVAHPYPCDIAALGEAVLSAAHEVAGPVRAVTP